MPNTKSAQKRLRQNVISRDRNRSVKSSIRTQIRKVREAIRRNELDGLDENLKLSVKQLDKAAARGVIHPNRAARVKSRLNKAVKLAKAETSAPG